MDDPVYEGMTAEQLLSLVPDDSEYVYLAVADARTAAPGTWGPDRTLLIVNVNPEDEDYGSFFRAPVSEWASIDANLCLGNTEFSEYRELADDVCRRVDSTRQSLGTTHCQVMRRRLKDRPVLTELLPGDTLRLGSLSSRSGSFVLVNQDDGDVVIYRTQDGATVWRTGTLLKDELSGLSNRLVLQGKGNLVVFAPTGVQVWNSGTQGREVQHAVLGDDGRLLLLAADGSEVWSSELPRSKPN
ncbi:hypothetical protein ABZ490_43745 [Streptomyces sp. NPDC005811]|uniref:DUF6924 domain-containing protein n=1 Tax=Streptomyces sp. NPDC005811 TaxID=3154565 RepID=UPI0033DCAC18